MPGVSPADFGLPDGTALRYERPADHLARLLPSYAVLDSDHAVVDHKVNWMLPSWAQIWIRLTAGPITVALRNRRYDPLQGSVMYGVTSRAMPVTAQGGITVAIDVSPVGWARYIAEKADALCDRVVPLQQLLPATFVRDLTDALASSDRDLAVKEIIDHAFTRAMPDPNPNEPTIERMMDTFANPEVQSLAAAADLVGIGIPQMQRLSGRYFGFGPKLLMMRSRFVRAIVKMLVEEGPLDHSATPPGYHNVPHFLRDADRFLGMTPRRFVAIEMPYARAALRARRLVHAAPTPSLDRPLSIS